MGNQKQITALIKSISGQANVLIVPRIFIDLIGDHLAAMFLSQCVYWSDKGSGGWFYKSEKDWEEELGLSRYQVGRIRGQLKKTGYIETELRRANGAPTMHYKVNIGLLTNSIIKKLDYRETLQSDCKETLQSLTEITQKTTTRDYQEEYVNESEPNIFELYTQLIGPLPGGLLVDDLKMAQDDYPGEWIADAFKIAAENNARNWKYIKTILDNWQRKGRDWKPEKVQRQTRQKDSSRPLPKGL